MDLLARPGAGGGSGAALHPAPAPPKPPPAATMTAGRLNTDLRAQPKAPPVIDLRPDAAKAAATSGAASAAPTPAPRRGYISRAERRQLTAAPGAAVHERHIAQFTDRFERARRFGRSAQISRFGADIHGNILDPAKMYDKFGNPTLHTLTGQHEAVTHGPHAAAPAPNTALASDVAARGHAQAAALNRTHGIARPAPRELPSLTATQHAAMTRLAAAAPAPPPTPAAPAPKPARNPGSGLPANTGRFVAAGAAVALMAGYIWFHNYPKLAIQNAAQRAGIAASLPSYLPTSYSLASTNTHSGLVALRFTSPSAPAPLTITQQSSSWDPSSLLDNYVAKHTDDYDAVGGEGLTIYLFGQNTATWVNHGIWYSIAGAQQLSRDQVLKIAYSL